MDRRRKFNISRRTLIGLGFIYLAGVGWLAEFIIPFLHIGHKAPIWVGVLIAAEILFLIGIAIIGKPTYDALKTSLSKAMQSRNRQ